MRMRLVAAAAATVVLVASCQGDDGGEPFPARSPASSPRGSETQVIALVGSSSGPEPWRGDSAFRGADLAVHELNRLRGPDDPAIELVTLDDGGDPAEATRLVIEQASSDRTLGIVYAGPPEGLPPAEEALSEAGIPAVLTFGDLYGARLLSRHLFQVSPSYVWEARRIVRYITQDRRYRTVGALTSQSLSGQIARRSLAEGLTALGRSLAISVLHPLEGSVDDALDRLRRRRVEAIVVEGSPAQGREVLQRLRAQGHSYRGTGRARIASARRARTRRANSSAWRPQVIGFDGFLARLPQPSMAPPGTIAAAGLARGAHYLPVPSFEAFRHAYARWWDGEPIGWESRAYEAVRMIGWAASRADDGEDIAIQLEGLRGRRFGGLDVTFGPDDHMAVDETTVGLWTIPRPGAAPEAPSLPAEFPWVPLGRGFSIDGRRTDLPARDWRFLFRGDPRPGGPPPPLRRALFGVTSPRSDPIH
jgi:ABC-type branched-subunit amino acid transport system substrate-binding protein